MNITQEQLLGLTVTITLLICYLVTQGYLIIKLGPKWSPPKPEKIKSSSVSDEDTKDDTIISMPLDEVLPSGEERFLNAAAI